MCRLIVVGTNPIVRWFLARIGSAKANHMRSEVRPPGSIFTSVDREPPPGRGPESDTRNQLRQQFEATLERTKSVKPNHVRIP